MDASPTGPIDTNVFIHAQTTDHLSAECRRFLDAVEQGRIVAALAPLVLHELSYVLKRLLPQLTRTQIADFMLTVLGWPGIHADKPLLADAIRRWGGTPDLGFVDAYLAASATRHGFVVYTKNVRDFAAQGVTVPDPLPGTTTS